MQQEYFECACHSDEHRLVFTLDDDPDYPGLYTSVYLNHYRGFFKRCWIAVRYVFGYRCKYGHFDCFVLTNPDEATRLRDLITQVDRRIRAARSK